MRYLALLLLSALVLSPTACARPESSPDGTAQPETTGEPTPTAEPTTAPAPPPLAELNITFEQVAEGFDQPLFVTSAADGSGRLFVVEKGGRIWILREGRKAGAPFLDISDTVTTESERGLLGLAFPSDFDSSARFYIHYSGSDGRTVISQMTAEGDQADRDSEQVLLTVPQPYANHNGGMIAFGPDEMLYIGLGDGGSAGDPQGNGQNLGTLLGTLLRYDVSGGGLEIPEDNPFVDEGGAEPAIWAYGLRNPWRFSFDRETGDLWIGDVGQNRWEEIDFQPASSDGGENYGWNVYEGTHPFPPGSDPEPGDYVMPITEYGHDLGDSVTGGYVYRGPQTALRGTYFYGDFGSGRVWGLRRSATEVETKVMAETRMSVVSFGEDERGELYVVDFGGSIHRVQAR